MSKQLQIWGISVNICKTMVSIKPLKQSRSGAGKQAKEKRTKAQQAIEAFEVNE
jgi:hypothetical protein